MTAKLKGFSGKGSFARGVHPPECKYFAENARIEVIPAASQVAVPLLQHTGAPAEAIVKPRQEVKLGEVIGRASGFISAAVHASINGVTAMPSVATLPNGRHVRTIPIKASDDQLDAKALWEDVFGGDWSTNNLDAYEPKQIAETVADAGIVGLGGAAFPTHVKLIPSEKRPIDTLLVNGCECEPYLTADYRLMLEAPAPIISGALLAAKATGAKRVIVAIEDNKPAAIEVMQKATE